MLNRLSFILCMAIGLCCTLAKAQDFFGSGTSARTASHAGVYSPSSADVISALALDPAGLSTLGRPTINVGLGASLATGSFSNAVNPGSRMRFDAGVVPFGAFGTPLFHSRWTVAAGFMPDLLSTSKCPAQFSGSGVPVLPASVSRRHCRSYL